MSILYCIPKNLIAYDILLDKIFTIDNFQISLYNKAKMIDKNEVRYEIFNDVTYYYGKTNNICWYIGKNGNKIFLISLLELVNNTDIKFEECSPEYNKGVLDYGIEIILPNYLIYDNLSINSKWFAPNFVQSKLCNIIFENPIDLSTEINFPKTYIQSPENTIDKYICKKNSDYMASYTKNKHNYIVLKLKSFLSKLINNDDYKLNKYKYKYLLSKKY